MTIQTADEVAELVQTELGKISLPEIVSAIKPLLVAPKMHMRNWDYGKPGEAFPCWTVLEHKESGTGIAYSDFGFGPKSPWGLIFLSTSDNWFGMDSGWFSTLEDAFCDSFAVGDLPVWNLIKRYENGEIEVVETALSMDEVCEKAGRLNAGKITPEQLPPFKWPMYSMERRR